MDEGAEGDRVTQQGGGFLELDKPVRTVGLEDRLKRLGLGSWLERWLERSQMRSVMASIMLKSRLWSVSERMSFHTSSMIYIVIIQLYHSQLRQPRRLFQGGCAQKLQAELELEKVVEKVGMAWETTETETSRFGQPLGLEINEYSPNKLNSLGSERVVRSSQAIEQVGVSESH